MLGAGDNVMARPLVQFPHNYNYVSREVMYQWFNKHLKLGLPEPVVEEDYRRLSPAEMRSGTPTIRGPPAATISSASGRWMTADSQKQMEALIPADAEGLKKFRRIVGGAWDVLIGRGVPARVEMVPGIAAGGSGYRSVGTFQNIAENERTSYDQLQPRTPDGRVVICVAKDRVGLLSLHDRNKKRMLLKHVETGATFVHVDLFGQTDKLGDQHIAATASTPAVATSGRPTPATPTATTIRCSASECTTSSPPWATPATA